MYSTFRKALRPLLLLATGACVLRPATPRLIYPPPYNAVYDATYRPSACASSRGPACPKLDPMSGDDGSVAQWAPSQRVTVKWSEDQNIGGFVRFSLVPSRDIYNHDRHQELAFAYSCFEQSRRDCGDCPSGNKYFFEGVLTVPSVLDSGRYVLSWVRFGSLDYSSVEIPPTPDLYSCAFVDIIEGTVKTPFQPFFTPDFTNSSTSSCVSTATAPGECASSAACVNNPFDLTVPSQFQNGRTPPPLNQIITSDSSSD